MNKAESTHLTLFFSNAKLSQFCNSSNIPLALEFQIQEFCILKWFFLFPKWFNEIRINLRTWDITLLLCWKFHRLNSILYPSPNDTKHNIWRCTGVHGKNHQINNIGPFVYKTNPLKHHLCFKVPVTHIEDPFRISLIYWSELISSQ